eukprot:365071-Chlamydomonas_euryale.AAC.12
MAVQTRAHRNTAGTLMTSFPPLPQTRSSQSLVLLCAPFSLAGETDKGKVVTDKGETDKGKVVTDKGESNTHPAPCPCDCVANPLHDTFAIQRHVETALPSNRSATSASVGHTLSSQRYCPPTFFSASARA